ncbi:methyltransferase domain-containing protein [Pseudomonas sp. 210_17 TE3656]
MVNSFSSVGTQADSSTRNGQPSATNAQVDALNREIGLVASQVVTTCGMGRVLDIGSGDGGLVASLLTFGVDAYGLDASELNVSRGNQRAANRFTQGSVLSLPFEDESFDTVVSTNFIEDLAPEDVAAALKEIYRVSRRAVFFKIATNKKLDASQNSIVQGRAWWETKCFEAGFRKHPAYYKVNTYESLNVDNGQIRILLEKIPAFAALKYPLSALEEERGLHMDMTRDSGERSDAHIIRYQWACQYIKPGDRVLDAACGLGYGSHVISNLTRASKMVGIDGSDYAIEYARHNFAKDDGRVEYNVGMLPEFLANYPDGSFDAIISFETLEHVESPKALLSEFDRLLAPGGRVIVSVPNDWSDETGEDPNPFHFHVYDWSRLKSELSTHFILENAYAQTASQCKVREKGNTWEVRPRSLHSVQWGENSPVDCEWWLMTAMKSPLTSKAPYVERMFANLSTTDHPSIRYAQYFSNPWLMHSMVNSEYRLKDSAALDGLAVEVMRLYPSTSNDYKAALCVRAYCALQFGDHDLRKLLIDAIDTVVSLEPSNPMDLRWIVSLLYVKAKIHEASGELSKAKDAFLKCSRIDVREFGVHLATKTIEAAYLAGRLAYTLGDSSEAKEYWQSGVRLGTGLLSASLDDVLVNVDFPNLFNHGDGAREYSVAWDNIARCANGIHLLNLAAPIDYSTLNNCHQAEYSGVTADLIATRKVLVERTEMLQAFAAKFDQARRELVERTDELVQVRETVIERTEELVQTRQALSERTGMLERAISDLNLATQERESGSQSSQGSSALPVSWFKRMFSRKTK